MRKIQERESEITGRVSEITTENCLVIKKIIGNLCESDLNVVGREKTPKEWV